MHDHDLRTRLRAARSCGVLHFHTRARPAPPRSPDARAAADAFVAELGFKALSDGWYRFTRPQALRIVEEILRRDLAYNSEIMTPAAARQLAEEFVGLFDHDAEFFSNSSFEHHLVFIDQLGPAAGWEPLTEATFDAGIVAVEGRRAGILWVEDED